MLSPSIVSDVGVSGGIQGGCLISSIVAGAFVGNIVSGPFADRVGRQQPVIMGYSLVVIFSVWSSFMNSIFSISIFRFFVGLGFGLGQSAGIALANELVPKALHFTGTCFSSFLCSLGAIFAVLLVMVNHAWLQEFSITEWRLLLRCAAVPVSVLGLVGVFLLPESPSFLAASGDHAAARDVLARLRQHNGLPPRRPELLGTEKAQQLSSAAGSAR